MLARGASPVSISMRIKTSFGSLHLSLSVHLIQRRFSEIADQFERQKESGSYQQRSPRLLIHRAFAAANPKELCAIANGTVTL